MHIEIALALHVAASKSEHVVDADVGLHTFLNKGLLYLDALVWSPSTTKFVNIFLEVVRFYMKRGSSNNR